MTTIYNKRTPRMKRHARIRANIKGTLEKPRLSVYRSNTSIYAQLIDDTTGNTIVAVDSRKITKGTGNEKAALVGERIAKLAHDKNISTVVFDRGGFRYHGTIKILAENARLSGLKF